MKLLIFFAYLLAMSVAEPPVGNGYPSNHHHDHYANDYQRTSPSQDYGPPPQTFGPNQDFGQARSLNTAYGPPSPNNLPQEYGPPNLRSGVSQEYGQPMNGPGLSRNSQPTSEYGVPNERSGAMDSYSAPIHGPVSNPTARLSEDFVLPNQRDFGHSNPSQEYGTPFISNPSPKYGPPTSRSGYQQQNNLNSLGSTFDGSKSYSRGTVKSYTPPKSVSTFNSPSLRSSSSNQYLPSSRSSNDEYSSQRNNFGPPSSNYGVPSQTSAVASSFQSSRGLSASYGVPRSSGVSDSYGPPAVEARNSVPSQQYGVPERNTPGQGYNYESVRKALEELQNQEPANYDFGYKVNDFETGSDFGHTETRQDNKAEGSYFVLLPDGTKQTVQYEADERGFKPRISVETVGDGSAGYDNNAANIQARNGPY